ncbi:hypothetical protein SARC_05742 [Sphaeroforma arctica JP610]|uniref:Uncharacterized protein n=1 Tax=Sphaeroforma arctica JP610 TaxID=667725 RepID=A0A0L0FZH7_9EUKA|nr:hypothetical protein SARC_05742 [Sphaeroforma arctica JP610]KNC81966.1 hypothetical protein SARC_05742 [Sphaeroforma arctica JP610]|eukprot:XP_014155868.1 hypothetical protein SARC_05742 [Sphaeroforma arctica JP610]
MWECPHVLVFLDAHVLEDFRELFASVRFRHMSLSHQTGNLVGCSEDKFGNVKSSKETMLS